jgi:predicted GNAT superfamily acetyltransferase
MITQKIGGVAAGAFDSSDRLVGIVVGFSGIRDGRLVHWSDMLAVRSDSSGIGIGRKLKEYQRAILLETGIETAFWTFDPLVARNAHFNFNRLGARPAEYVIDMYGADTGSVLHSGLGTDRFIMQWNLNDPLVEATLSGELEQQESEHVNQAVNTRMVGDSSQPIEGDLPDATVVGIEIPGDIHQVKLEAPELAMAWRTSTRRAFKWYMEKRYYVAGFRLDKQSKRGFYSLARNG